MELQKFDKERVLTTWKARISLQKDVLESLGVPLSEHGGDDPEVCSTFQISSSI
jgi:hypothetical protein